MRLKIIRYAQTIIIAALFILSVTFCREHGDNSLKPDSIKVTDISIEASDGETESFIWLGAGSGTVSQPSSVTLYAIIDPDNASNKNAAWSADTDEFVDIVVMPDKTTVVVIAKKVSLENIPTIITVKTADGNKTASHSVTVLGAENYISVETVNISPAGDINFTKTDDLFTPLSASLTHVIKPDNASIKTVTWHSTNTSAAAVSNGVVTPAGEGEAEIYAVSAGLNENDEPVESNRVKVTVINAPIPVTSITISAAEGKTSVIAGDDTAVLVIQPQTLQFSANVLPANASDKSVIWSVSDSPSYSAAVTANAGIIDPAAGLLTAAAMLDDDTPIWVFATAADGSGIQSAGMQITVRKYVKPTGPFVYNFSDFEPFSALGTETVKEGLILGSGCMVDTTSNNINGTAYSQALRIGGNPSQGNEAAGTPGTRYIGIPVSEPSAIYIYGTSNNSTQVNINVNNSKYSNVQTLGTITLPGHINTITNLTIPSININILQEGIVYLWAAGNVRIYKIEVIAE